MPLEECDYFIEIGKIYAEPKGDMTDKDAKKEGDCETVEEFERGWEAINGLGSWDPEFVVAVVPIAYVGRCPTVQEA